MRQYFINCEYICFFTINSTGFVIHEYNRILSILLPFNWLATVFCSCGRPKTLTTSHASTKNNKTNRRLILLIVTPPI